MNEKDLELEDLNLEEIMKEFGITEESESELVNTQDLLGLIDEISKLEEEQAEEIQEPAEPQAPAAEEPEEIPEEVPEETPEETPDEAPADTSEEVPAEIPEETAQEPAAAEEAAAEEAAPELSDTVRLDDLSGITGEVPEFAEKLSDETQSIGSIWDEEEQAQSEAEDEEDVVIPSPIVFRPKQRLRELKRELIAGPERRYYELAELGVGKLQLAMLVCFAVVLICGGTGFLYGAGLIPENRLRLMVFGQVLAMLVGALMGSQQLIEGVSDLFRGRFTLNTLMVITFGASCADAWLCLQELRVPICAAFTLEVLMSLWAAYHRRTTEMGQMDTMRKASRLDGVVTCDDYLDGKRAYLRREGQVADFMEHYDEIPRPERIQNGFALIALLGSVAIAVLAFLFHGISMAVQIFSTTLLVAVPASFFVSITRPMAVVERRLHRLGAVLCGWTGIKGFSKKALFPLVDQDLFPKGSSKLNGVKFYGKRAPEVVISYAAAMMEANGGSLAPIFEELLVSRSGLRHEAHNLQFYGNGGIGGEVCEEPVLMGSLHFLKEMGIEVPEGTSVKQAVYVAIDGELSGLFAISYARTKYTANGLATLCGNRKLRTVILAEDFMVTAPFLKEKFGVRSRRVIFPDHQTRQELMKKQQTEGTTALAMTTVEGLAPVASAITGARAVRTAWKLGLLIHLLGGILGLLTMASLAYLGNTELLTPLNILAYQLIWAVPGVLVTFWPRTI